jgi:spermidine/putrescine transport system ATP-binding protein
MTTNNAIEIRGVSKFYGYGEHRIAAVSGANLAIRQNEFFTLLGPSGCGKTTLLRLIAGFEYPQEGELLLHGENIAAMPPYKRPINTVFQSYALFPHMEELATRQTSQLSGGQQQRVALARALAPQPKVLLLDEPLSALDYKLRKEMQIELKRLQTETGITFVFVTHDQEEALTMSDRVAVMSSGNILQVGSPREIYDTPANRFVADFIGETNFLNGKIAAIDDSSATLVLPAGATLTAPAPQNAKSGDEITVMVRPEHARLASPERGEEAVLSGTLANIIYFGTDTYFNVRLADGEIFTVRQQNRPGEEGAQREGEPAGVIFPPSAIRVLRA